MLNKVVIFADSLALAREGEDDISYEATYPFLIEQHLRLQFSDRLPLILERGMRRRTIEYVLDEWFELVELRRPNLVILHVGVVDCAPRIFLRRERHFVETMRWRGLRNFILGFVNRHRARIIRMRPRVYVSLDRFGSLITEVVERAHSLRIPLVFVNIIEPPDELEQRSPGFCRNVKLYNNVLESKVNPPAVRVIDLNGLVAQRGKAECLTRDGIHLSREGHKVLSQELEDLITKEFNLPPAREEFAGVVHASSR